MAEPGLTSSTATTTKGSMIQHLQLSTTERARLVEQLQLTNPWRAGHHGLLFTRSLTELQCAVTVIHLDWALALAQAERFIQSNCENTSSLV
jgi:hypothetical protein